MRLQCIGSPSLPFCFIETSWRLLRMWEQFWFQGTHLCFETRAGCLTLLWEVSKSSARSSNTAAACWTGLKMERNLFARFGDDPFQKHSGKWIQLMDARYIYPPFGEEYPCPPNPTIFNLSSSDIRHYPLSFVFISVIFCLYLRYLLSISRWVVRTFSQWNSTSCVFNSHSLWSFFFNFFVSSRVYR